MSFEQKFSPNSLRRYKRGEIIKVHLGYNIGSEEGGLHYAIALDKNNSIYNPVITIVPLTSLKPDKDLSRLRKGEIFLGRMLPKNYRFPKGTKLKNGKLSKTQYIKK